ncbi:MAG: PD-(D/E)XK nuclease family protein [Lachnospiraceae bacterium]|nr:PD-(D/E)XK nuclease family protein [Lachnospiraceae bacterium]
MSLRFIIGGSGSGKSTALQEEIIKRADAEPGRQFIIIVPDQFTMQTQKEIVERTPRKGIMNIDVQSFGRLCHRLADEVGASDRIVLDDTGKNLLLRRIAGQMAEELPAIGSSLKHSGYIHEVKSVISEFMQYGLGVEEVQRLIDYAEGKKLLQAKLRDVKKIYAAFQEWLGQDYIAKEEKLEILAGDILKSEKLKGSVVAFDGFTGFTPVQDLVITQLLSVCSEVIVTIILPAAELESYRKYPEEHRLFSLSDKTMRSLEQLAHNAGCARGEDLRMREGTVYRYEGRPVLDFLEQNLFRGRDAVYTEETGEELSCFVARDPKAELREIFRRIRTLTRERGLAYRDIAVVSGDLERYAPYAEELAAQYDIPIFLDNNQKLEQNPFVEWMRSAFEIVAKDFPYESMMHFLKSGMTDVDAEDADALENYLIATGLRGESAWKKNFTRRPKYLKEEEGALERLNAIREQIMGMLRPLSEVKRGGSAEQITTALYRFITENSIFEKLEAYVDMFHEAGDMAREKEYAQIYRYVCELLEQIAALLKDEELSLNEYLEILEAGIAEIKVGVLPLDVDRVVIGDMERTRLKPIRVLFFAGVNDGVVPKASGSGGMISDLDREFLASSGFALAPTPRQQMFIQRLYLYHVMSRPAEQLIVSYAQMDPKGDSIRPSYLIGVLRQMFLKLRMTAAETQLTDPGLRRAQTAEQLSLYAAGMLADDEREALFTLYDALREEDAAAAEALAEAAFYRYHPKRLSEKGTEGLYGRILKNSVSRMEQFAECAYAHYLKYGIRLQPRETHALQSFDIGNLYHAVLENFGRCMEQEGLDWKELSGPNMERLLKQCIKYAAAEYGAELLSQDARTSYQWRQMERVLRRTLQITQYQLSKGDFVPVKYESDFQREVVLPGQGGRMLLQGKIDRLDRMAQDGKLYLKVTDYKSGQRKLAIESIYAGMQLQLLLYLKEAVNQLKKEHPGEEVIPAAAFYYILRDPIVEVKGGADTETEEAAVAAREEILAELRKELRVTGLISADEQVVMGLDRTGASASDVIRVRRKKDGEYYKDSEVIGAADLQLLMDYVEQKVAELGSGILSGEKAAAPFDEDSCKYCAHKEICPFDRKLPGCRYRSSKLDKDTAWELIRKKMGCEPEENAGDPADVNNENKGGEDNG